MEEKFKLELKNSTEEYNRTEVEMVQYGSRATRRGERGLGRLMEVLSKTGYLCRFKYASGFIRFYFRRSTLATVWKTDWRRAIKE